MPGAVGPHERRTLIFQRSKQSSSADSERKVKPLPRHAVGSAGFGLVFVIETEQVLNGGAEHPRHIQAMAESDPRIVLTGFVQGEVLQELFSNAYAYVMPSDLEGMPMSLLEAMAYGNCCLTSDIPECTEVVEDKALTFLHGSVDDLAAMLQKMADDPAIVTRYKREAAGFITGKYSWDRVVDQTLALYAGDKDGE